MSLSSTSALRNRFTLTVRKTLVKKTFSPVRDVCEFVGHLTWASEAPHRIREAGIIDRMSGALNAVA